MNNAEIARYIAAGYTHLFQYEAWAPIAGEWAPSRFPTVSDSVVLHEAACSTRMKHGEIRNLSVSTLSDLLQKELIK
jgi:hypothetical protein